MRELKRKADYIRMRPRRYTPRYQTGLNHSVDEQLWVDKHAPSSFPHLLSDERTNREVLRAVRAWDPYVFGRDPPKRPQGFIHFSHNNDNNESKTDVHMDNKNDTRPDERNRVILLSGPPGVGKITILQKIALKRMPCWMFNKIFRSLYRLPNVAFYHERKNDTRTYRGSSCWIPAFGGECVR